MKQDKKFLKYWADMYSKKNVFGTVPTKLAEYAAEILHENRLKTIMEAGGGQGRDAIFFSKLGYEVDTCDISPDAIRFINKMKSNLDLKKLNAFEHDFTRPFTKSSKAFDFVYSNLALQFCDIDELERVFANISMIMKENSLFLFSTKKKGDKYHEYGKKLGENAFEYNNVIRYFFERNVLENLLDRHYKTIEFDSESHTNLDSSISVWWKILVQKK